MSEKQVEYKKPKTPFWKLRGVNKGIPIFENPAELWEAACDYFKFIDDNPHPQAELVKYKGSATLEEVPKMKPYTLSGLCFFLGCSESYFRVFKHNIRERGVAGKSLTTDTPFMETIEAIEQVIETQQLEGAMVGAFNYNIVRAKLGLVDKQDVTSNGETILNINVQKNKDLKNMEGLE